MKYVIPSVSGSNLGWVIDQLNGFPLSSYDKALTRPAVPMARVLKMTGGKLSLARDIHGCLNICFARPASLNCEKMCVCSLSKWPRGLRRRSAAARLLGFWVRIPPGTWMSVCCECCVLSGRGLCDGLITRPEESYRLWCVVVCNLETSSMRRPWPALGRSATEKKVHTHTHTHTHTYTSDCVRLYMNYRCYQITLQWNIFTQIGSSVKC